MDQIGWLPPIAHQVYCIRHVTSNFNIHFTNKALQKALTNAGYAKTPSLFRFYYNLVTAEPQHKAWLDGIPLSKWTCFYDEGHKWGHMTTNLVECINKVLRGTRDLPITAIVRSTYFHLCELIPRRGRAIEAQIEAGHIWSEFIRKQMEKNVIEARRSHVSSFSRRQKSFTIEETLGEDEGHGCRNFKVDMQNRVCECGEWHNFRYPCRHAVAGCMSQNLDWGSFTDGVYRLEHINKVYELEFEDIGNSENLPIYQGLQLLGDPAKRRINKGWRRSTRICNEMDLQETGELPDGIQLAVKKLEGQFQGAKEFRAEVTIIGKIRHAHLVKLRGFCAEGLHRLLVYEYMAKGSLDKWIFNKSKSDHFLDWKTRFNIALGTAKGLAYLHEECEEKIVHCDIKPENVLLDEKFNAKVSDFGLAKLMNRDQSLVHTTLRGTRGYLAPEWITNAAISKKRDVLHV